LDEREGRAPPARFGQLALGLPAQRGEFVLANRLQQSRLERDAELKRQSQIRMAWLERDDVRVQLGLLDADIAQQFRKPAARLAPQGGKDLREQSDQSLGRRGWGVEVPRAQVPLLQNK
jgi:hypothetical protein